MESNDYQKAILVGLQQKHKKADAHNSKVVGSNREGRRNLRKNKPRPSMWEGIHEPEPLDISEETIQENMPNFEDFDDNEEYEEALDFYAAYLLRKNRIFNHQKAYFDMMSARKAKRRTKNQAAKLSRRVNS